MRTFLCSCFLALSIALPASAATIRGVVSDATGGSLPSAHVVVRDIATGQEKSVDTDAQGNVGVSLGAASERSLYHVLVMGLAVQDAVRTVRPNLDLLPSNETLAAAESGAESQQHDAE